MDSGSNKNERLPLKMVFTEKFSLQDMFSLKGMTYTKSVSFD